MSDSVPGVRPRSGLQREQLGGLDLDGRVGELEAQPLEPPDRLPELLSAHRPLQGGFEHPLSAAHRVGRDGKPGGTEPLAHQVEAAALVAEQAPPGSRTFSKCSSQWW